MAKEKSKKMCAGCYNDHYNKPGNSIDGECWLFANAKVIPRKKVHVNQAPPWTWPAVPTMTCYRVPQYVFINCENGDRQQ